MEAVGRGSEAGMDAAILLRHTDFVLGHTAGNSFAWKQSIAGPKQEYSGGHGVCGPQGCSKKRENTHIWSNTNSTTINQTTFLQLHTAGTVTSRVPTQECGLVYCGGVCVAPYMHILSFFELGPQTPRPPEYSCFGPAIDCFHAKLLRAVCPKQESCVPKQDCCVHSRFGSATDCFHAKLLPTVCRSRKK